MRTPEEINEEIKKVEKAKETACRKIMRCDYRLMELKYELEKSEEEV